MAYPIALPTKNVSFGQALVFESGTVLAMRVTIAASRTLVFRPSGQPLVSFATTFSADVPVGSHTLELPICDSDDMGLGNGLAISLDPGEVTHTYSAVVDYLHPTTGQPMTGQRRSVGPFVVLSTSPDTVDLDDLLLTDSVPGQGVAVYVPDEWSSQVDAAAASASAAADSASDAADSAAAADASVDAALVNYQTALDDYVARDDEAVSLLIADSGSDTSAALSAAQEVKFAADAGDSETVIGSALSATIGATVETAVDAEDIPGQVVAAIAADGTVATAAATAVEDAAAGLDLVLSPENSVTVGKASIDITDGLVADLATPWGIGSTGVPYFDDTAVTAGEEAVLAVEAGQFVFTSIADL